MARPIQWCLVVPVKRLDTAKSRLTTPTRALRADLALAFAADTVAAGLATRGVAGAVVVTDDARAREVLRGLGASVVPDEPGAGLNDALRHGATVAARRHPGCGLAALSADLPALRPAELEAALHAGGGHRRAFVSDGGSGTTLLMAARGDLTPAFGEGSRRRHLRSGAVELTALLPSVRLDVDTEDDLAGALRLGVGPHTATVAAALDRGEGADAHGGEASLPSVQATVRSHDTATRSGTVLLDDGVELPYDAEAFETSGLRLLRLGQRVRVRLTGEGTEQRVVSLALATLPD